jgi:hypothetical protein
MTCAVRDISHTASSPKPISAIHIITQCQLSEIEMGISESSVQTIMSSHQQKSSSMWYHIHGERISPMWISKTNREEYLVSGACATPAFRLKPSWNASCMYIER